MRLLLYAFVALGTTSGGGAVEGKDKPDNAKLILGKWEFDQDKGEIPRGTTIEFAKDGGLTITAKEGGKVETISGTYKVEDDKLLIVLKLPNGKEEKKPPLTIKRLTEKALVLTSVKKDDDLVFKRVM